MKIARAIDIGYGSTKFTVSDGMGGQDIECRMFPSVAPVASKDSIDKYLDKKDSVIVDVDGEFYEVGTDAMLAMPSNAARNLDLDFVRRASYMALAKGAMHYMGVPRIDHLVIGLPVSSMKALADAVKAKFVGKHQLPGKTITVENVECVPQPVGGLLDYASRHQLMKQVESSTQLLIDPGYFTLDWLVVHGRKMAAVRSGAANNAGMAAIVRAIAEKLTTRIRERDGLAADVTESVLQRIDEALRTGREFRFNGKAEPLEGYLGAARHVIDDGLAKLRARVGALSDVDSIVLVGGSAHVYERAVCDAFPGYDIRIAKEPVFANVRGFQLLANKAAKQTSRTAEAAAA
jgi:plasmid segregation protein ParM